jgi:hypothetical protein
MRSAWYSVYCAGRRTRHEEPRALTLVCGSSLGRLKQLHGGATVPGMPSMDWRGDQPVSCVTGFSRCILLSRHAYQIRSDRDLGTQTASGRRMEQSGSYSMCDIMGANRLTAARGSGPDVTDISIFTNSCLNISQDDTLYALTLLTHL